MFFLSLAFDVTTVTPQQTRRAITDIKISYPFLPSSVCVSDPKHYSTYYFVKILNIFYNETWTGNIIPNYNCRGVTVNILGNCRGKGEKRPS